MSISLSFIKLSITTQQSLGFGPRNGTQRHLHKAPCSELTRLRHDLTCFAILRMTDSEVTGALRARSQIAYKVDDFHI